MAPKKIPVFVAVIITMLLAHSALIAQPQTGLFWGVTKKGSTDTSYLLGTIHQYPKNVIEVPCVVKKRLERSKNLYLEIHQDWKMGLKYLTSGNLKNLNNPEQVDLFSKEELETIKAWFLANKNMTATDYDQLNSFMGLPGLYLKSYGFEEAAMEENLRIHALTFEVRIKGLDKNLPEIQTWYAWYQQLAAAEKQQSSNLEAFLENGYGTLADLITSYAIQDTTQLAKASKTDHWKDGLSLAEWRNHRWMQELPKIMAARNFVAVGAAHLFGANGLLRLLQEKGFELIPIPCDFTGPKLQRHILRNGKDYQVLQRE